MLSHSALKVGSWPFDQLRNDECQISRRVEKSGLSLSRHLLSFTLLSRGLSNECFTYNLYSRKLARTGNGSYKGRSSRIGDVRERDGRCGSKRRKREKKKRRCVARRNMRENRASDFTMCTAEKSLACLLLLTREWSLASANDESLQDGFLKDSGQRKLSG